MFQDIDVARKLTTKLFIERSHTTHHNQYDYQLVEFETTKDHVSIICPVHGIFTQRPDHHMQGSGCPICSREKRLGGYTEELFRKKPEIKILPGILYFIKFESDEETFHKIGITSRSVHDRFNKKGDIAHYSIELVSSVSFSLYEAYTLEQYILSQYSHFKYVPQKWFSGWTECLFLEDTIINEIQQLFFAQQCDPSLSIES